MIELCLFVLVLIMFLAYYRNDICNLFKKPGDVKEPGGYARYRNDFLHAAKTWDEQNMEIANEKMKEIELGAKIMQFQDYDIIDRLKLIKAHKINRIIK